MTSTSPALADALAYAAHLHRAQIRKGTTVPYVSHLLQVAGLAFEYGADEPTAIAAVLHDAAEDQGGESILTEIRTRYGDAVADVVAACSDTFETPKPPWRARKESYIAHLVDATPEARLVSACDKLHNATTIVEDLRYQGRAGMEKFKGGVDGTLWYYEAVVAVLEGHVPSTLHARLSRTVGTMRTLIHSDV